ncbi:MAG: ATP synthase subunit I [Pyrinomonadaceae bacterium]
MSETSEPITDEQENLAPLSHRRILLIMGLIVAAGSVLIFIFLSWRFGLGFLIGGILSFVNYYWLKISLKNVFERVVTEENPRFSATRYFLRYFVLGAILTVVYLSELVPFVSVVTGLLSFAFAILIEGLIRIFTAFFNNREI